MGGRLTLNRSGWGAGSRVAATIVFSSATGQNPRKLVLTARNPGVFSLARPIVEQLRTAGFRLSDRVMKYRRGRR
jgi:hypothetical protein